MTNKTPNEKWRQALMHEEIGHEVGAGILAFNRMECVKEDSRSEVEGLAFSTLVQFQRRKQRLSIEALANAANVAIAELLQIESDPRFIPKPRTVHQLATVFKVPVQPLSRLSGLTDGRRPDYEAASIRFAAMSKGVQSLSREEDAALNEFLKFISKEAT